MILDLTHDRCSLPMAVETGRRFFPNCSEVLDRLSEDEDLGDLMLKKGTQEEQSKKRVRYTEIMANVKEAFNKDIAEQNWVRKQSKY